ncbi:MAG: glutaredoxin domain-containing protein, partial [Planctomycetota bacterium]|nr:glutaredoxin domain-containing protein [Planctomycetota bacterium]
MKDYLTGKGLEFEVKDIHNDDAARDDLVELGLMSIPVTVIDGGAPIVG